MKSVIAILTKSPHPEGRKGLVVLQDWYKECKDAVFLHKNTPNSEIVITSAVHINGAEREEKYYVDVLKQLGEENIVVLGKGLETTEQLEVFKKYVEEKKAKLILIVTWTHFLRVLWMAKRMEIPVYKYKVSLGLPRPKELITDFIMTFVYPIYDLSGEKEVLIHWVKNRREGGKF
jgi:hypothetical protein